KWDRALPHLARGGDAGLKAAAEKDLANPGEAAAQAELADAWRALGLADTGPLQKPLLLRARHWYAQAKPQLDGDALAKVDKHLKDIDTQVGGPLAADLIPTGGNALAGRSGKNRELLVAREGGNAASEAAVEAGLKWIVRHQAADGHWGMHD